MKKKKLTHKHIKNMANKNYRYITQRNVTVAAPGDTQVTDVTANTTHTHPT